MKKLTLFLLASLFLATSVSAASAVRHDVSAAVETGAINRVIVEIPYAHLTVKNGSSATIDTYGYVTRSWRTSKGRDKAQAIVDASAVRIDIEGTTAFVRRHQSAEAASRKAQGSGTTYVVAIRVPVGTDIRVRQKKGSLGMNGRFGTIDVELSSGDIDIDVPKVLVGELIARTRFGHVSVHLGDRIIEKEGFFPSKAHYFFEGGQNVLTTIVGRGNISISLD